MPPDLNFVRMGLDKRFRQFIIPGQKAIQTSLMANDGVAFDGRDEDDPNEHDPQRHLYHCAIEPIAFNNTVSFLSATIDSMRWRG
eukprot:scaffold270240_cov56-Cyclotella_meneghiniana.AAC.1